MRHKTARSGVACGYLMRVASSAACARISAPSFEEATRVKLMSSCVENCNPAGSRTAAPSGVVCGRIVMFWSGSRASKTARTRGTLMSDASGSCTSGFFEYSTRFVVRSRTYALCAVRDTSGKLLSPADAAALAVCEAAETGRVSERYATVTLPLAKKNSLSAAAPERDFNDRHETPPCSRKNRSGCGGCSPAQTGGKD